MIRVVLALIFFTFSVWAVEPEEILDVPALETRAREISKELRCLVCRNENIDSSNAGIAKDLRILVRERLVVGDSDEQVMDYVVDRYGEYVLLKPPLTFKNMIPWVAGPLLFLIGLILSIKYIVRPRSEQAQDLSKEEEKRLKDLLGE